MKARIALLILAFVLLVVILGWVFTPVLTPRPIASGISNFEQSLANSIFLLLQLSAALIIIGIGIILIRLIVKYTHSYHIVIEPFQNATTDEDFGKLLIGFNQLIREELVLELESFRTFFDLYKSDRLSSRLATYHSFYYVPIPKRIPIPEGAQDSRLIRLINSLQDTPSWELRTAVELMNIIFPPRGIKVTTTVQSLGDTTTGLGISLEVADLRGQQEPVLYTIWAPDTPTAPPSEQSAGSSAKLIVHHPQQFMSLLKPVVVRWLTIELMRRSLVEDGLSIHTESERRLHQAKLYNLIGMFHQAAGQDYEEFPKLFRLAIEDFKKAISLFQDWYLPYENMADTFSFLGEVEEKRRTYFQHQALISYNDALDRLDKNIPQLSTEQEDEKKSIRLRILIGRATVQLLMDDLNYIRQAKEELDQIMEDWDLTSEMNYRLLYNFACLYALADKQHIDISNAKQKARRYLTYSLIRNLDRLQWGWAEYDPDLATIDLDWEKLISILTLKLHENPALTALTGNEFDAEVSNILSQCCSTSSSSSS